MLLNPEFVFTVSQGERDFGKTERFSGIGSVEDHIGHFPATERFGRLFAQNPANRIQDVGLSAAVRADDGRNAFVEFKGGFIREGLKSEELERLKVHAEMVQIDWN